MPPRERPAEFDVFIGEVSGAIPPQAKAEEFGNGDYPLLPFDAVNVMESELRAMTSSTSLLLFSTRNARRALRGMPNFLLFVIDIGDVNRAWTTASPNTEVSSLRNLILEM
jgi:hypothetical protein